MYNMPEKAIKNILKKEHESFVNSLHKTFSYGMYYTYGMELMEEELNKCNSYEDLEEFINNSRRMSLQEWIDSL